MTFLRVWIPFITYLFFIQIGYSQDALEGKGNILVRGQFTSGYLKVNFTNNTVVVDLGSHNKMFHQDIELIEFDESQEKIVVNDDKFYLLVTDGSRPLLERENQFYSFHKEKLVPITTNNKEVYALFGKEKKTIRNYAFARDLNFDEPEDILAIFEYYNSID